MKRKKQRIKSTELLKIRHVRMSDKMWKSVGACRDESVRTDSAVVRQLIAYGLTYRSILKERAVSFYSELKEHNSKHFSKKGGKK